MCTQYLTKPDRRHRFYCDEQPIFYRLQCTNIEPIALVDLMLQDDSYLNPTVRPSAFGTQPIFHLLERLQHETLHVLSIRQHQEGISIKKKYQIKNDWLYFDAEIKFYYSLTDLMQAITPSSHRTMHIKHTILSTQPHCWSN